MRILLRRLREVLTAREQKLALVLLVLMMLGAVLEMAGVGAIPAFVTLLSNPSRVTRLAIVQSLLPAPLLVSDRLLAISAAGALLLIFLIKNSYLAAFSYLQARYTCNRQIAIARRLFNAYLNRPYTFHLQRNSAELLRNANQEAMDVVGGVLMPGLVILQEVLTVIAILALLLLAEPFISLVALTVLGGATTIFIRAFRHRMVRYGQQVQHFRFKLIQTINEGLGGIKTTKVLGRERHFLRVFDAQASGFAEANRFRQVMLDVPRLYLETAAMLGLLGVAALLLSQNRPVQAIVPTLSLLAVATVRMIPSFNRITSSLTLVRYGRCSLDVVHADLKGSLTEDLVSADHEQPMLPFNHKIVLDEVEFRYPGAASPSLRGVSLEILRGTAVGFVGPTGAGKTTMVDIILGLFQPTNGRLLVDQTVLHEGNARGWQRHIGYVPQDIFLIDDTIRRNVAFGLADEDIDEVALRQAITAAQLDTFIDSLPDGVSTVVGERGVRLSGGQRQRIGIARALYHNPQVLVFDEATSSLDNETERYVLEAVEHLRGQRTIIMVAHRLSTVRPCDRLFVLEAGELVDSGTYDDLLGGSRTFRRLAIAH